MLAIIAIICILFSIASGIILEKAQFYRRNSAGIETHKSYGAFFKTRLEESLIKALGTVSALVGLGIIVHLAMK